MSEPFDRWGIRFRSVRERTNKFRIDEIAIDPDAPAPRVERFEAQLDSIADEVRAARQRGAPVVICHGAHPVKNGLGPLIGRLVKEGWLTHVATNGAGSIHDWEFAFLGASCEHVEDNVAVGEFGIWEETGAQLGLAILTGALDGLGYGESVSRMISTQRLDIPSVEELRACLASARSGRELWRVAAAADLLAVLEQASEGRAKSGRVDLPHRWKATSLQCACIEAGVPFTVHPGIGQDIVYTHPFFRGGAVGRTSMTDFLRYASVIAELEGGVYLSVGSSVMSPMIFEKSLSMARNVRLQQGGKLDEFLIVVNDLADVPWDWSKGEPPVENPAYYVRFCKSFSRMGGRMQYIGLDNRIFLQNLYARLRDS